jgi:hypothetical protein
MTKWKSYQDCSRISLGINLAEESLPEREVMKLGAILRIADSLDAIAAPFKLLQEERNKDASSLQDVRFCRNMAQMKLADERKITKRLRKKIKLLEQKPAEG